ncbi:NAD(P)H-dependent oxidoreductase [Saccharophagus degradans]|uniref:NADPH-dependent FMN reductase n=1 Tax=Saccharophagus degradans TaxID=86304 RepID=UPI002477FBB3|nr:NAD(P)H-dependent oxidoreductase [Saccharophagus degradans]WGO98288.1 NAD(P)H-dependent oxidoreductase [Saccharophagus degradans]
MTTKIVAFAASSSSTSINKRLVTYATQQLSNVEVEILDLNDFEMPLFSVDRENALGSPDAAQRFYKKLGEADGLIISFAEHNGSYTAAYKNLYDWTSRIDTKVFQNKPVLALATSPGKGGGANVLAQAVKSLPHFGANVVGELSIPQFNSNFDTEAGKLTNTELDATLKQLIKTFASHL